MPDLRRASVLLGVLTLSASALPARPDDGAVAGLYAAECAFCHGAKGAGDGPASSMLTPQPTAFANAAYWKSVDRAALGEVIAKGKSGTGMMGFAGKLTADQIVAMVEYLESFAR